MKKNDKKSKEIQKEIEDVEQQMRAAEVDVSFCQTQLAQAEAKLQVLKHKFFKLSLMQTYGEEY